jgi:hypothetical protein
MRVGTLVRVKYPGDRLFPDTVESLGEVRAYNPDVLGGSCLTGAGKYGNDWNVTARRGEVLVLCYDDGSISWYDESNVQVVTEE